MHATSKTVAAVEGYIGAAMKASTFTDDQLRPAFETLVRSTNSVAKAHDLLGLAMNVAAAKGIPLETATLAVTKASEGQFAAVNKLVPGLVDLKDKTLTAEDVTKKLADTFSGAAAAATETTSGKMQNLKRDMGELVEGIGASLLPILTTLVDTIRPLVDWFTNLSSGTQKTIVIVGLAVAAIGPLISVVTAVSGALAFLAASPIVLAVAGIAALAAGLVLAYQKSEIFRDVVQAALAVVLAPIKLVKKEIEFLIDRFQDLVDIGKKAVDIVSHVPGAGVAKNVFKAVTPFASGGIVTRPTLGLVGEAGPEAIIPLSQAGNLGGGGTTVLVQVAGSVISEQRLIDVIVAGINRNKKTGGSVLI